MGWSKAQILAILPFFLLLASCNIMAQSNVFDIKKYGAKDDAKTDISKELLAAWKDACEFNGPSEVLVPKGTYMLGVVKLQGPCKSSIKIQVQGILKAPPHPNELNGDNWFVIAYVNNFKLYGGGTFDGQGQVAWKLNNCNKNPNCRALPVNIRFNFVNNSKVEDITSLNSKNFHVSILGSNNLLFKSFKIVAPADSINTDGIHVGESSGLNITDSKIGTGDDCISIGPGTKNIGITRVTCGPGHGISVGSLGKSENQPPVIGVFVNNSTFLGTDNGVRIKTWPASYPGIASNIHFENIIMNNVSNPIVIDQVYCPWNQCNKQAPSKVKISDVSFKNIRGTSSTPTAIQLSCSSDVPCQKVELAHIDLKYNGKDGPAISRCSNVKPTITKPVNPTGCYA